MEEFVFIEREPGFVNIVNCSIEDLRGWDVFWEWDFSGYPCPGIIPMGQLCLYYAGCSNPIQEFRVCSEGLLTLFARAVDKETGEEQIFPPIVRWVSDSGWKNANEDMCNSWFWPMKLEPTPAEQFSVNWSDWSFTGVIPPEIWQYSPTDEEVEKFLEENPDKIPVTTTEYCVAGANVRFQVFDLEGPLKSLLGEPRCLLINEIPPPILPGSDTTTGGSGTDTTPGGGGSDTTDCGCDCYGEQTGIISTSRVPSTLPAGLLPKLSEGLLTIKPLLTVNNMNAVNTTPIRIKINFICKSFDKLWTIDEPTTRNLKWWPCLEVCTNNAPPGWYLERTYEGEYVYLFMSKIVLRELGSSEIVEGRVNGNLDDASVSWTQEWDGEGTANVSLSGRDISVDPSQMSMGVLELIPEIISEGCQVKVENPIHLLVVERNNQDIYQWGISAPEE